MENYKLRRPIDFEGKKIEDLNFDFESLTRKDYKRCIREMKIRIHKKEYVPLPVFNETFQLVFAAAAAGVASEALFRMYPRDIVKVGEFVVKYFFGNDEDDDEDEELEASDSAYSYKLKDHAEFCGKKIEEFIFDFDGINYAAYNQCIAEARKRKGKKEVIVTPAENETFQLCFAAKAAGFPADLMFDLSLRDSFNICLQVRDFLSGGDLEEEEEADTTVTALTEKHKKNIKTLEN